MAHDHRHDLQRCCEQLQQLNAYVDGELAADLCHTLEQHLAECADCRVVLDTLTNTIALYHALADQPIALPPDIELRLRGCLSKPQP